MRFNSSIVAGGLILPLETITAIEYKEGYVNLGDTYANIKIHTKEGKIFLINYKKEDIEQYHKDLEYLIKMMNGIKNEENKKI